MRDRSDVVSGSGPQEQEGAGAAHRMSCLCGGRYGRGHRGGGVLLTVVAAGHQGLGGGVAVVVDHVRCRRCGLDRSPWWTFAVAMGMAAVTYLVSLYAFAPLLVRVFEWIAGSPGGGGEGGEAPTLP